MSDVIYAVQEGVFALLNAAYFAPIYVHVPENTQPPYVVIGDIGFEVIDKSGIQRLTVDVICVHRTGQSGGRKPLMDMLTSIRTTLENVAPIEGSSPLHAIKGDVMGVEPDGVTYGAHVMFEVFCASS